MSKRASFPLTRPTIIIPSKDKKDEKVAHSLAFNSPTQNFRSEITQTIEELDVLKLLVKTRPFCVRLKWI